LTNHQAAEHLHGATDRDATPPRVHATPPGQYGLEFRPGVFGSARPTSRPFSAVFGGRKLSRAGATTPASVRGIASAFVTSASTRDLIEPQLDAARCGARVKVFDPRARNARAGGGGGGLRRLAEIAPGRRLSSAAKPRRPPRLAGFDRSPIDGSSKQLPTNQRDTDNAEKHEPNEIHPEDYGVCVAYDQSICR
jgi:hypothetical protein